MNKIKSFKLSGFRGIRDSLTIDLDGRSILLYGDNGSGKSSISDAFEWFYYDSVKHLAGEEIGRNSYEALRNFLINKEEPSLFRIKFTKDDFDCEKTIEIKKKSFSSNYSNDTVSFNEYRLASKDENLLLRHQDLINFIMATKTERLKALSDIIGFSEVTAVRDTLKKTVNSLNKEIKTKDFDNQINRQQANLLESIGQNIVTDEQFVTSVNEMIAELELGKTADNIKEIKDVLELLKDSQDTVVIEQQMLLNKIIEYMASLPLLLDQLDVDYDQFFKEFQQVSNNAEKLAKIALGKLLSSGFELLSGDKYTEDICPLCLQPKSHVVLLAEVQARSLELENLKKEVAELDKQKKVVKDLVDRILKPLDELLFNKLLAAEGTFAEIKERLDTIKVGLGKYYEQISTEVAEDKIVDDSHKMVIDRSIIELIADRTKNELEEIKLKIRSNSRTTIHSKIVLAENAYKQIKGLENEKAEIEKQRQSLELVYLEFVKKQKEGLEAFLNEFSKDINDIYEFMNPHERVSDMRIVPLEKDDELAGLTIQFKFYDSEVIPPQKFLSESHLNCFGLAFFLASVRAFNNQNRFFILDDVISSFDSNHRKRFADLLIDKFEDYQIIILTHETHWYNYMANAIRNKWITGSVYWKEDVGTYLDEPPETLINRIEASLAAGRTEGIGNDIRKYLEHILKDFAINLEVRVKFLFNDKNEDRMAPELLSELKSKINKASPKLAEKEIEQLSRSMFIGNKDSHDSSYNPSPGDLKAYWNEVKNLESVFLCSDCGKRISLKYYDNVAKHIRCKCGNKTYSWK